ncbi:MAG: hypothetical protein Q9225_000140 [Loekoesia sp. 1 TL-2023]
MESLNDTTWDVLISGTGPAQSLLALALSRSGKKVLHIDQNDYYGGAEAAFSLQEAETWVEQANAASQSTPLSQASIRRPPSNEQSPDARLGFSRAYSISLAPKLIYTRSNLIPALVSSKVYRQLEFLAVGSWWLYDRVASAQSEWSDARENIAEVEGPAKLRKIPGGREDVFADKSIDLRSTRSLMKFLKLAADFETYSTVLPEWGERPFIEYLESQFKIDARLQAPLLALTLSPDPPSKTTVAYALPRIHRHLTSIGIFGPGFGAVIPKWGGLAEIAQVACRAGAVGGGVYVLKKGIESVELPYLTSESPLSTEDADSHMVKVQLQGGDTVKARWIIGTPAAFPKSHDPEPTMDTTETTHLTAVISSPLTSLFLPPAEGSPPPAGVVVVLPPDSLQVPSSLDVSEVPAIYLMIHSSDTGECPEGQCIIYTSTSLLHPSASDLLSSAIQTLLSTVDNESSSNPEILWSLTYKQNHPAVSSSSSLPPEEAPPTADVTENQKCGILHLKDLGPSLALEDEVLRNVRAVWERITADDGDSRGGFMQFEDREGLGGEGEEF